jgi:CBS domain-containing protein
MRSVGGILKAKGGAVWSVGPDDTVFDALRIMADKGIGAVVVLDDDQVVGIFSERDYARRGILEGRASKDTRVREIMTRRVVCVSPRHTLGECLALMTDKRIRHLPVQEGDSLIGVVSIGDLVKGVIDEQEFLIEQLEYYVSH